MLIMNGVVASATMTMHNLKDEEIPARGPESDCNKSSQKLEIFLLIIKQYRTYIFIGTKSKCSYF